MSEQPQRPIDVSVLHADDALLDALGRGGQVPSDDGIAALLAAWRAELADQPAITADQPAITALQPAIAADDPAVADEDAPVAEVVPISRAWQRRRARLAVAAAVLAVVAGGTGVAAAQASPGSPLWPITHLLNPDRAHVIDAQSAIVDARGAVTDGRTADAQRLLEQADTLVSRVRDPGELARLRAELDDVRHLLATVSGPAARSGTASASPAPGTVRTPTPGPGGQPAPPPGPTGPGHPEGSLVPTLPVPTSLPPVLPTSGEPLLPSLPVIGGLKNGK